MTTIAEATMQIRAEYLEAPTLHLKAEQVQRLCDIEATMCQLALDSLVAATFLRLTSHGRYARVTDGESEPLILRQPERRRYRSDAELRHERAERERQWNTPHPPPAGR